MEENRFVKQHYENAREGHERQFREDRKPVVEQRRRRADAAFKIRC